MGYLHSYTAWAKGRPVITPLVTQACRRRFSQGDIFLGSLSLTGRSCRSQGRQNQTSPDADLSLWRLGHMRLDFPRDLQRMLLGLVKTALTKKDPTICSMNVRPLKFIICCYSSFQSPLNANCSHIVFANLGHQVGG